MRSFRLLLTLLLLAFLFLACLLFVVSNPAPVRVDLLVLDWQPHLALGSLLLLTLILGLLLGALAPWALRQLRALRGND